jgi:hypothetical protein
MKAHQVQILRAAVIAQAILCAFVALFLLVDLLEQPASGIGANIGTPFAILIMLVQLTIGVIALVWSRPINK